MKVLVSEPWLFASAGEPPPDGTAPQGGRQFARLLDSCRIREDLGFMPIAH